MKKPRVLIFSGYGLHAEDETKGVECVQIGTVEGNVLFDIPLAKLAEAYRSFFKNW